MSFPSRTSVGRQPGSQLPPWSFPYTPLSLSQLERSPLHLCHCLPTQAAPFSCQVLPCWIILPGFPHLVPSSRLYSFIRKRWICVGPRVLLDYHDGTQQLERGRSTGAKSSSYHSLQKELVTGAGAPSRAGCQNPRSPWQVLGRPGPGFLMCSMVVPKHSWKGTQRVVVLQ